MASELTKARIRKLFHALNAQLAREQITGEIYLVGGAVMCLALKARTSTSDLDAWFEPKEKIREAAGRIAEEENLDSKWLNDAVKGFLSEHGTFNAYLNLSNLHIFTARPDYLLAMKCMSFRVGKEFKDEDDVRFLLRYLNVEHFDDALSIVERYYPCEMIPQKTFYALKEIFGV